jgi:hypothetical protein
LPQISVGGGSYAQDASMGSVVAQPATQGGGFYQGSGNEWVKKTRK